MEGLYGSATGARVLLREDAPEVLDEVLLPLGVVGNLGFPALVRAPLRFELPVRGPRALPGLLDELAHPRSVLLLALAEDRFPGAPSCWPRWRKLRSPAQLFEVCALAAARRRPCCGHRHRRLLERLVDVPVRLKNGLDFFLGHWREAQRPGSPLRVLCGLDIQGESPLHGDDHGFVVGARDIPVVADVVALRSLPPYRHEVDPSRSQAVL